MASEAQIAANRLNAQKSTGPRSAEGQAVSSRNALTTGVYAQSTIIRGEDPAALDLLTAEYYATHTPTTAEERLHLDSMIRFDWQLRRLTRIEAELYESPTCPIGQIYSSNSATFARLTRQVALIQRCFRDASNAFKSLRETNPIPDGERACAPALPATTASMPACLDLAETNPILTTATSEAASLVCGPDPVRPLSDPAPPAETNPISTHTPPPPPTRYPRYDANGRIVVWEYVPRSKALDGDRA